MHLLLSQLVHQTLQMSLQQADYHRFLIAPLPGWPQIARMICRDDDGGVSAYHFGSLHPHDWPHPLVWHLMWLQPVRLRRHQHSDLVFVPPAHVQRRPHHYAFCAGVHRGVHADVSLADPHHPLQRAHLSDVWLLLRLYWHCYLPFARQGRGSGWQAVHQPPDGNPAR